MLFQVGEFSAFLAIIAYAIVPMIRYTRQGLATTPPELLEAAVASGATKLQVYREIRLPWAAPTILLRLNQTILYAFVMLVIAALIGTTGLGQAIYLALVQQILASACLRGLRWRCSLWCLTGSSKDSQINSVSRLGWSEMNCSTGWNSVA